MDLKPIPAIYLIELKNGEKMFGNPRPLNNNPKIYDVWYVDPIACVIKSRRIAVDDVKEITEVNGERCNA